MLCCVLRGGFDFILLQITHGDIKSQNVLLLSPSQDMADVECKISDFGFPAIKRESGHVLLRLSHE